MAYFEAYVMTHGVRQIRIHSNILSGRWRRVHTCPVSDSQSDIVTPRTETASLLDGNGGGVEPFRRPYSVQSHQRHQQR